MKHHILIHQDTPQNLTYNSETLTDTLKQINITPDHHILQTYTPQPSTPIKHAGSKVGDRLGIDPMIGK
jgi:hypothetical protein